MISLEATIGSNKSTKPFHMVGDREESLPDRAAKQAVTFRQKERASLHLKEEGGGAIREEDKDRGAFAKWDRGGEEDTRRLWREMV